MTGEVTLTGLVLPIGGIKEKVLAARRAGIKRVIMPRGNQKDLRDLPEEVRNEMEFIFADRVEDVLRVMLPDLIAARPRRRNRSRSPVKRGSPPAARFFVRIAVRWPHEAASLLALPLLPFLFGATALWRAADRSGRRKFLDDAKKKLFDLNLEASQADWIQSTYITDDSEAVAAEPTKGPSPKCAPRQRRGALSTR